MIIEWSEALSIGIPEIDVEHKFFVTLLNDLHRKILAGESQESLAITLSHLIRYTEKHFSNEESLMQAIDFPLLKEHKEQHYKLADQVAELSQMYLLGSKSIGLDLVEFLKRWISHHILVEDSKISAFIGSNPLPSDWGFTPAFSDSSETCFKACTLCGKEWKAFEDLAADQEIVLLDPMIDRQNHFYNLVLFNCTCDSTLAIPLFDFVKVDSENFYLEENSNKASKPDYCMTAKQGNPCLKFCACAYTSGLVNKMAAPEKR